MHIAKETLDDLLRCIISLILHSGEKIKSSRGDNLECNGVLLELKNPLARLSRTESKGTVFSCLGEFFWYLTRSDDCTTIDYYLKDYCRDNSDDGKTIWGAYGPRLFNMRGTVDQVTNVINLLSSKPSTRRAVIQLFNAEDISDHHKDIPCTCTLQFIVRNKQLHLLAHMRSNDAFLGLPHDVFSFTMLQELMAKTLNYNLGSYKHFVGSMHLYERDKSKAEEYLNEGYPEKIAMPEMPPGDPWAMLEKTSHYENQVRQGYCNDFAFSDLDDYWANLMRLLAIFRFTKEEYFDLEKVAEILKICDLGVFKVYVKTRVDHKKAS